MAKINSKNKGSSFERKIAALLTAWSGMEFHRTPGSGSLHWKDDNNVTGDIVAPFNINFPISIECKKHEVDWEIDKLLIGTSSIWKFWRQACEDSLRHEAKEPFLIFSKNRREIYLMMHYSFFKELCSKQPKLKENPYIIISTENKSTVVTNFKLFLDVVSLNDII